MIQQPSRWTRRSPTIRVGALGLFAAFLLVLPLALAPRAEAYIYWAGCGDRDCTRVDLGRANLDGSNADPSFISGAGFFPQGVAFGPGLAVSASHVYWTSEDGTSIGRAKLDGSGINLSFIASGFADGLAVSASHVYWTSPNSIGRANLDGTGVNPSFISGAGFFPVGVAVDARHIYWATQPASEFVQGSIGRANLNGTGVDPSFIAEAGFYPFGVAVDAGHIYWTSDGGANAIARAKLDGTHVDESFISLGGFPFAVAVDANHVYWAHYLPRPGPSSIGRANLNGTHVEKRFIGGADLQADVAAIAVSPKLAGKATAATTQGQSGKEIVVRVRLRAKEQLTAKASGKIKVNPTYKLRSKKAKLATGETKTLRLKPKKAKAKRIARALKRGKKANAKLTVKLTDLAGNTATERLRVRLKRG